MAFDITAVIRLQDKLTAPLRRAMSALKEMETTSNKASSKLSAAEKATNAVSKSTATYTSNTEKASRQTRALAADNDKLASSMKKVNSASKNRSGVLSTVGRSDLMGSVGGAIGGVGIGMAVASSGNKAMDFEAQLSSIKALTGASTEEMKLMTDLSLEMGAKTKYSALEAAQGIEELVKAGMEPATVKAGGLEAALNLATAGSLDLTSAAEIMSTSLNAFYKDGMNAADASNVLAGTANASATSVEELRYSLAAVGAVAGGIGMTFKDTNAALGVFANKGLKGSDAGTSLKTMLNSLQPSTKEATEVMRGLGIITANGENRFYTAAGKVKSFAEISEVLQTSMRDLTDMQRQQALETLFGSDAVRAANIAFEVGADGVNKFTSEMTKVTALEVATEKMNNAKGAIEQFKGAMETMQITALTPLLPSIKKFVEMATVIAPKLEPLVPVIFGLAGALAIWLPAQLAINLALTANPIGLIVVGIGVLIGVIYSLVTHWDTVKKKTIEWWDSLGVLGQALVAMTGPIGALIAGGISLIKNWDTIKSAATSLWENIKAAFTNGVNGSIDKLNTLIGVINKIPGVNIGTISHIGGEGEPVSVDGSHAGGLDRVPYNGYVASLHKDERVQTKAEADVQRGGNLGGLGGITITGNTFNVRQDSDIESIAKELAREIWNARSAVTY